MNIISARYANTDGGILIEREGEPDLYIDKGGIYERAMAGEFGPIAPPPEPDLGDANPVPQVVSRFQARHALREAGLRDQIEQIMSSPDADPLMVDAWSDAWEFRRSSPTVASLAGELGLTSEQVDDLFRLAATIEA